MLAAYHSDHDNRRGIRPYEDPVPPLDEAMLAAIEAAVRAPRFDSYSRVGMRRAQQVARMMASPFAPAAAWGQGILFGFTQNYLDIARRLGASFDEAAEAGRVRDAERIGRAMVTLGIRVQEDSGLVINQLTAIAIQDTGYARLEGLYEGQGMAEQAESISTARAELEKLKETARAGVPAGSLFLLPVPSIQTALIGLAVEDEIALAARFAETIAEKQEQP